MPYITPQIITLNAKKIFTYFPKKPGNDAEPFCLDITNRVNYNQVIKQTAEFDECPLIHQIVYSKTFKKSKKNITKDDKWLLDILIIIDYGTIFNCKTANQKANQEETEDIDTADQLKVKDLIENGLKIKFADHCVTMFPFDKSGNMSRNSRMTFINSDYYDEVNERLNLEMDFSKIEVQHSKYYSYRGLYLTSSKRVSDSEITLDEETLMVMNDKRKSLSGTRLLLGPLKERGIKYFTAVPGEKKGKTRQWKYVSSELEDLGKKEFSGSEEQKKIEDDEEIETPFDGVGLISKEYAEYINRALKLDGATSFQIRLPFAKGMLHQVDFREFIQEYDCDGWDKKEPYMVTDAFGISRDLRKVQIIMTTSMFKCFNWLVEYCGTENDNDPMQFYSEMLHKYKHSLYVAGTNLQYGHSAYTHLSYQMINTLDFTDQEFENIISKHKKFVEDPVSYLKNWNSEEATAYEDTEIDSNVQSWKRAVFSDSQFEKDIYIAEQLNSTRKGLITKLAKGKVAVAGQMRYLCRDLLPLLALLLKNDRDIDKFWPRKLYNRFYMPQDKKNGVSPEKYKNLKYSGAVAFFRSPHLSRNEECVLHSFEKPMDDEKYRQVGKAPVEWRYIKYHNQYNKYFGHLTGVVMVPRESIVPLCLGGADFDGDLVNVVYDEDVVNAVIRGNYSEEKGWKRKTPVIKIPSTDSNKKPIVGRVSYEYIKYTFSNSIGRISNAAISVGQEEYTEKALSDKTTDTLSCAKCTILTGLEIDAAKNGIHPDLSLLKTICSKAPYLQFLDDFKKLTSNDKYDFDKIEFSSKTDDTDKKTYEISVAECSEKPSFSIDTENPGTKINKLPVAFKDEYECYREMEQFNFKTICPFKKDTTDFLGRKEMMNAFEAACDATFKLYGYYKNILLRNLKYEKNRFRVGYKYIERMIYRLYDKENANRILDEVVPSIIEKLNAAIPITKKVLEIRENIIKEQWQFQKVENRGDVLEKIIGNDFKTASLDEEERNVLFHFNQYGYKLLWYILTAINDQRIPKFEDKECEVIEEKEKIKKDYFDSFDQKLKEKVRSYYDDNLIHIDQVLSDVCKKEILKIYEYYRDLANTTRVCILYKITDKALYKKSIFWELFSWRELQECLAKEADKNAE